MKNMKKKGFTLVELLVVIAIIAILATVSVIGYTAFIRKANISNDTVIAGELNTLLEATNATDTIESFDDVKAALYANGFYLANLNTKTDGCYFVWDKANNQIILVDSDFQVLFSKTEPSANKADWHFAVSDFSKVDVIKAAGYTVEKMVTDINNLADAITAGGEFHIDNSLVLKKDHYLKFEDSANVVINMGDSQLMSDGTLENQIPVVINDATVVLNGGIIGATGTSTDLDGKTYATPIKANENSDVTINGTKFNSTSSEILFGGKAELNDVESNVAVYSFGNGNVELNKCTVNTDSSYAIWVTNTIKHEDGSYTYDGASTLTVNSGKYVAKDTDATYKLVSMLSGVINIKGGEFVSPDSVLFYINSPAGSTGGKIVITDGTFNGVDFEELDTVDEWKALCNGDYNVVIENGTVTICR